MARTVRIRAAAFEELKAAASGPPPTATDLPPRDQGGPAAANRRGIVDEVAAGEPPADGDPPAEPGPPPEAPAPVKAVIDEGAEERRKQLERRLTGVRRTTFWVLALATIAAIVFALARSHGKLQLYPSPAGWGLAAAFVFLLVVMWAMNAFRTDEGGFFAWIIDGHGRLSTSLTQAALWTLLLSSSFIYFFVESAGRGGAFNDALSKSLETLDPVYLLLLGGPFAATVTAGLLVRTKLDADTIQKVDADAPQLKDVVSDDGGNGDLIDAQFFVFNLVAILWFIGSIASHHDELPTIPPALVGLTSLSALTYTASKAAAANAPVIRSITRRPDAPPPGGAAAATSPGALGIGIRPGDQVDIAGLNFVPPGADTEANLAALRVRFGTRTVPPDPIRASKIEGKDDVTITSPTDRALVATVPLAGLDLTTTVPVTVVTAAGAESEPFPLTVDQDVPVITSVEPSVQAVDGNITIHGRYLRRSGQTATSANRPTVFFGGTAVPSERWTDGGNAIVVKVPKAAAVGPVNLKVRAAGGLTDSAPVSLIVREPEDD